MALRNFLGGWMLTLGGALLAVCSAGAGQGYTVTRDIPYAAAPAVDPRLLSLDVYVPDPQPAEPMPVVIWVHGGGWETGDKANQMEYKPPLFTGAGYCFVSVNYRLSPDPPEPDNANRVMYPVHEQDVAAAVAWVHANIADYGGDPERLVLMGHSAGAHLVSLVSTDESFLAAQGVSLDSIRGTVSLDTAAYDIPRHLENNPSPIYVNAFGNDPALWAEASPINHLESGKGIPPFFIACRGSEKRYEICTDFASALENIGDTVTVMDASAYTHSEVNQAVGAPGETTLTPPLMRFLAEVFSKSGGATVFELSQTLEEGTPESSVLVDLDEDGLLDLLVAADGSIGAARNEGDCRFSVATVWPVDRAKGWGLYDFNSDGRLDPFIAQPPGDTSNGPDCALNNGDGTLTFVDKGNNAVSRQRNVLFADFDGDGLVDSLHISSAFRDNHHWCELHRGLPGGQFDPENAIDQDAPAPFWHQPVALTDQCTGEWANSQMKGGVVRDFDGDGRPDVVMAAWADAGFPDPRCPDEVQQFVREHAYRGVFILQNVSTPGHIRFEDVSNRALGEQAYGNWMGMWEFYAPIPFDYDLDGDLDLLLVGLTRDSTDTPIVVLLRNDSTPGSIVFTDVTSAAGDFNEINSLPVSERSQIRFSDGVPIDYDNDGWVDVALTNRHDSGVGEGGQLVYLFRNTGDGRFILLDGAASGLQEFANSLNYGDLDSDGHVDLVVHDKFFTGATYVYRNAAVNVNHWIQLEIRDRATGAYAFGTRVTVYEAGTNGVLGTDEVRADFAYRSKRTPILHFGLASVTSVDLHVVTAHNRQEEWFRGLVANSRHVIEVTPGARPPRRSKGRVAPTTAAGATSR